MQCQEHTMCSINVSDYYCYGYFFKKAKKQHVRIYFDKYSIKNLTWEVSATTTKGKINAQCSQIIVKIIQKRVKIFMEKKTQNMSSYKKAFPLQEIGIKQKTQFGFTAENVQNNLKTPIEARLCTCLFLTWGTLAKLMSGQPRVPYLGSILR